jgi:hypothetical protein
MLEGGTMPEDDMGADASGPAEDSVASSTATVETLWTRRDLAVFLKVSDRWVDNALARDPGDRGSIPHVVLPSRGTRRHIRFVFEDIRAWVAMGCPSADEFARVREEQD